MRARFSQNLFYFFLVGNGKNQINLRIVGGNFFFVAFNQTPRHGYFFHAALFFKCERGADFAQEAALGAAAAAEGAAAAAKYSGEALRMLTRGQLRMNLDLGGSEDPMRDMARAADRLTMGIIIAGLFIGSSVVYYARIKPVIFGIPVIGFVGYLVALGMGVGLAWQILHEDRRRRH